MRIIFILILAAILAMLFCGCNPERKSMKAHDFFRTHKVDFADDCANAFPRNDSTVIIKYDSAGIQKTIDSSIQIQDSVWNDLINQIIEQCNLNPDSVFVPSPILKEALNKAREEGRKEAQKLYNSLPPKIIEIIKPDKAREQALTNEINDLRRQQAQLTGEKDACIISAKKYKGKIPVPWWWLIIVGAAFGGLLFLKFKSIKL